MAFWDSIPPEFQAVLHEAMLAVGSNTFPAAFMHQLTDEALLDPRETIERVLQMRDLFLWVHGPAGCGKTHTVLETCDGLNRHVIRWQGSTDATPEDLLGGLAARDGNTFYQEGPLPLSMTHDDGNGCVMLVDEISACRSDVTFEFHAVLEGKPLVLKLGPWKDSRARSQFHHHRHGQRHR